MTAETYKMLEALEALGLSRDESAALRRAAMALHRWSELECGGGNSYALWSIERDEATDLPYLVTYPHTGPSRRQRIADREAGALRRVEAIMAAHPELVAYHQTDPRGMPLYVLRRSDLPNGGDLAQCYARGVAVGH